MLESARTHEMRGDEAQAFEAYRAFAQFDRDAVDVNLRFAAMARARLGAAQARTLFRELTDTLHSPSLRLAAVTLVDLAERRKALEIFVTAHPGYGPARALLANEFYRERIEDAPLRDRLRERELLNDFLGFDAQGKLAPSFVDSTVLAAWLDRAERRLATLDTALTGAAAAPIAQFTRSNSTWMVNLNMPEEPSEVSYRIGTKGPFTPTGESGQIDSRTGRKIPVTNFDMPLDTPPTIIFITYRDVSGHVSGPFEIPFDPNLTILTHARAELAGTFPGWVAFSDGETNSEWAYFNTPMATRCVIKLLEYGFDGPPNTPFPLPPCNMRDPSSSPADSNSAVRMGPNVRAVSVRLTLTDGSVETRVYRRRVR